MDVEEETSRKKKRPAKNDVGIAQTAVSSKKKRKVENAALPEKKAGKESISRVKPKKAKSNVKNDRGSAGKREKIIKPTTSKTETGGKENESMDYKQYHLKMMKQKWKKAKIKRKRGENDQGIGTVAAAKSRNRSKAEKSGQNAKKQFGCCDLNELLHYWNVYVNSNLTAVEREELKFEPQNVVANIKAREPGAFFKKRLPDWDGWLKNENIPNGSPLVIVVSPSALRAVEINRALSKFKGKECRTVKLIRKEKAKDQADFLTNKIVHFVVGTPHRIQLLLTHGTLKLDACRAVALDWSYEDQKKRRLITIPEIRSDLVRLFHKFLVPFLASKNNNNQEDSASLLLF